MSQVAATVNPVSSRKCFQCGLQNFADRKRCDRCKANLSQPLIAKPPREALRISGLLDRSKFKVTWILAALALVVSGLVLFSMRPDPAGAPAVRVETVAAPTPVTPAAEVAEADPATANRLSAQAAAQIVTDLKRFEHATLSGIDFPEYDRKLKSLKSELNDTLPSFVRQDPGADTFRVEIAGALREYTAAGNWWKTTIKNNTVFTEADRDQRTQTNFEAARTHLANAEKTLGR